MTVKFHQWSDGYTKFDSGSVISNVIDVTTYSKLILTCQCYSLRNDKYEDGNRKKWGIGFTKVHADNFSADLFSELWGYETHMYASV